jgi:hypothetical protein
MKAELVSWKDAVSVDEWTAKADISPTFHIIRTLGFIVAETGESLVLALNHDTTADNFACFIHIPLEMIISRREIKIPQIKKPT